jgi:hypothetical protein
VPVALVTIDHFAAKESGGSGRIDPAQKAGAMPGDRSHWRNHRVHDDLVQIEREGNNVPEKQGDQIVETAIEARGAERGPTVRNVLVWSLGLAVAAMVIVWFVFFQT